ncbi:MAG: DUF427 domain-containing protein [Acidimicrobiia bacterium]|nr:DUF427 domain-containing protein [Acidimicrobiia bacterium]
MIRREPGAGRESVWDYPRPPQVEREPRFVKILFNGETIVESSRALRVLETSHPPNIYVPFEDVSAGVLDRNPRRTTCEWKGIAEYWNVRVGEVTVAAAAWSYPQPSRGYDLLAEHVSFYPGLMEGCYLGEELVEPQAGAFYGGWITSDVVGPFKGGEGTWGW